jgi:hypothetical protein
MARDNNGIRANWKCLAACTLISMSPFQYGVDFTLIGGFQAMIGFLKVYARIARDPVSDTKFDEGLWRTCPGHVHWMEYQLHTATADIFADDSGRVYCVVYCR